MLDKPWLLHILRAHTPVKPVNKESLMTATRPGKALAEELQAESHPATLHPTIVRLTEASHAYTEDLYFRLLSQLLATLRISTTGLR
jgi:hypothetical protein